MAAAFHSAYLDSATPFWPSHFSHAPDRRQRTLAAAQKKIAPELLAVLREQNPRADLTLLSQGNVALVITGRQIGLFLGPLYTIYKAATAIVLARRLSEETGVTCLPLFWLQSEDHDFAEIAASTFIDGSGHVARVELSEDPAQARTSVGQRTLGKQITPLVATLSEALGERGRAVSELIAKHYRPGAPLVDAFSGVLTDLFDDLLVFNPRDARVAELAKSLWRKALDSEPIEALLDQRDQALQLAGFHQQIKLRPQSPLLFFHADNERGPRHRLQHTSTGFVDRSETHSRQSLLALCDEAPLRFSTSAMLRPLLQDTLLPTAAYVGGAAELDYFAQIEPLYAHFGLVPPLLFHRARFRLWPIPARRLLEQLGLNAEDTARPFEELCQRLAAPVSGLPEAEWKALEARLAAFAEQAPAVVKKTTLRAQRSIADAMARLSRVTHRAQSDREDSTEARLRRLLAWTQPEGQAQERALGFMSFAARSSLADFRAAIFSALDPFDASLKDLHI